MDLTALKYFCEVVAAGSFVGGARRAHVTPAAVSKAIQRLEADIGAPLLERTTRRVALTPHGELLARRARELFDSVDGLRRELDEVGGAVRGEVRVAAMEVFSLYLLPAAITRLVARYPQVVPRTYEMIPELMEQRLLDGALDVGFTIGGGRTRGIAAEVLGRAPGALVCGRAHPLYRRGRVAPADLLRYPSVVPRFFGLEALPALDQFGLPRRVGATIELLQMGIELAVQGAFLGYFPEVSVRQHLHSGALRALRGLDPQPPFELEALTRAGLRPRAAVVKLVEQVGAELRRRPRSASRG